MYNFLKTLFITLCSIGLFGCEKEPIKPESENTLVGTWVVNTSPSRYDIEKIEFTADEIELTYEGDFIHRFEYVINQEGNQSFIVYRDTYTDSWRKLFSFNLDEKRFLYIRYGDNEPVIFERFE